MFAERSFDAAQHVQSVCVGRVSSDSRCASRRRERERLGSPQSTGRVGWGGVGSKFSMRLGSEWAWFALEGKDHASLQKGTRVESRDVGKKKTASEEGLACFALWAGWLAGKKTMPANCANADEDDLSNGWCLSTGRILAAHASNSSHDKLWL